MHNIMIDMFSATHIYVYHHKTIDYVSKSSDYNSHSSSSKSNQAQFQNGLRKLCEGSFGELALQTHAPSQNHGT